MAVKNRDIGIKQRPHISKYTELKDTRKRSYPGH